MNHKMFFSSIRLWVESSGNTGMIIAEVKLCIYLYREQVRDNNLLCLTQLPPILVLQQRWHEFHICWVCGHQ